MQPLASVAVIVNVTVSAVVGVPNISPLGRISPFTLKVYGSCPPLAVMLWL